MAKKKTTKKTDKPKVKGLFDHVRMVTNIQDPDYFSKLSDADRRTWSNYMIHRFLSMNADWTELISMLQPYTQTLEPKYFYKLLIGVIPKGRHYLRYIKGSKEEKYENWLIDLIKIEYMCSTKEAQDYAEILYATKEGREHIKYICQKYGTDPKEITKLKLKV